MKHSLHYSITLQYSTNMPNINIGKKWFLVFIISCLIINNLRAQGLQNGGDQNTATWTGAASADWCNTANWAGGKIPDETSYTVIPANTPNLPVVTCTFSFNAYTGNIDVQPGATLTIPANKTLNINGNFVNTDESRYVLTGRINFGGKNQTVPGFTYNSLTVSGGGTKTLAGNAMVNGILVLTNGILVTDQNKLLTLGYRSMISAGYGNAYVDGPLKRLTNTSHSYSFPIGYEGTVRSVVITPDQETDGAYTVYYHKATVPNNGVFECTNLMANQQDEYWDISRSTNASNAVVQVEYNTPASSQSWSNRVNPSDASNVAIVQNTNGAWSYKNAAAAMGLQNIESAPASISGQMGSRLETDFSHVTFGYGFANILPVNLLAFTASLQQNNSLVNWTIEQGTDNVMTELEHSTDNKHFEKLADRQAGNATLVTYTHNNPATGAHYYRLLITDKARNTAYSKTIQVIVPEYITRIKGMKATLVRTEAFVKIESARSQQAAINLYDMSGHLVTKQVSGLQQGENSINISTLMITPGIYNLYVQTADGVKATLRFMKE
ncbi:hypothetical protein BH10BAC3_BH10BAC3_09760 [soil metagenome]